MPIAGNRSLSIGGGFARAIKFQPDANTVLWLPGQDDAYSSIIRDRSGNNNNGTITGATPVRLPSGLWVLSFDGNDFITIADNDVLSFGDGSTDIPFSLHCWLFLPNVSLAGAAFSKATTAGVGEYYITFSVNYVYFRCVDNSAGTFIGRAAPNISSLKAKWFCLDATYSGSKTSAGLKLYANTTRIDVEDAETGVYGGMENTTQTLRFGLRDTPNYLTAGSKAALQVVYRNVERSPQQIAQIYNQERHLFGV